MGGRSVKRTPGVRWRRGPTPESGLARSDQTGSVKIFRPLACSRTVEWFISVTRICCSGSERTGTEGCTSWRKAGGFAPRIVSFQRRTSSNPRACFPSGLKKRTPSKWEGNKGLSWVGGKLWRKPYCASPDGRGMGWSNGIGFPKSGVPSAFHVNG
jgi:hypothetical protein